VRRCRSARFLADVERCCTPSYFVRLTARNQAVVLGI
jgi:hypothetical protein